jgi:hypothetical protein
MYKFIVTTDDGTVLNCHDIKIVRTDRLGFGVEVTMRSTDGKVAIYADHALLVEPRSSNLIYVQSVRDIP